MKCHALFQSEIHCQIKTILTRTTRPILIKFGTYTLLLEGINDQVDHSIFDMDITNVIESSQFCKVERFAHG